MKFYLFSGRVPSGRAFRFKSSLKRCGLSAAIPHATLAFMLALPVMSSGQTAPATPQDSIPVTNLDEVVIMGVRASQKMPVSFSNLSKEELESRNLGQDIPQLLNFLPSVVSTSDAGTGIGYTGIRVRGSDATRVNVTLNGVPYNDAESHGTFWVNLPDFASSTQSLQLQRGVGTSTNGSGAFGASLNIVTDAPSEKATAMLSNSFGSFNTRKHTLSFSSGMLGERFEVAGRLSNIYSDGYIDRAFSDLKSYFLQGVYRHNNTQVKGLVFGGDERTYQSWNGLEDVDKLQSDRTYNTAGEYYDEEGNLRFYDNQTDNYKQDHYQLHWTQSYSDSWRSTVALHYTRGKGYYENYRQERDLAGYGIEPSTVNGSLIEQSDLIDRKWLDNHFYGFIGSVQYKTPAVEALLGGGWNQYLGDHFGRVLWVRSVPLPMYSQPYYEDDALKTDYNVYGKVSWNLSPRFSLFGDLQLRGVHYSANGEDTGIVDDRFSFFNPKAGLTYFSGENSDIYFSYGRAHREPNRVDYESGTPRPERLDDFELGWRLRGDKLRLNVNAYYMAYQDQLVLTGMLNDVGNPIRENSGRSYRLGVEAEAIVRVTPKWTLRPNVAVSTNRNRDFYFERDGALVNLGDTEIAFSPSVVAANAIVYAPVKNLELGLLTKYVGSQYMGNIDSAASRLDAYSTSDLNISYRIADWWWFKEVQVHALVNNIFDYEYESNGYFYTYDDSWSNPGSVQTVEGAGFYPQAGTHFMVGLNLRW